MLNVSLSTYVINIWICIHFFWTCCMFCECTVTSQCEPHSWPSTPYLLQSMAFIYMHIRTDTICPGLVLQTCEVFKDTNIVPWDFCPARQHGAPTTLGANTFIIYTLQKSLLTCIFLFNHWAFRYWPYIPCFFSPPLCPTSSPHKSQVTSFRLSLSLTHSHRLAFASVIKKIKMLNVSSFMSVNNLFVLQTQVLLQ